MIIIIVVVLVFTVFLKRDRGMSDEVYEFVSGIVNPELTSYVTNADIKSWYNSMDADDDEDFIEGLAKFLKKKKMKPNPLKAVTGPIDGYNTFNTSEPVQRTG